ncbi:hypothetical protein OC842_004788 [Tilletia horrida]|uniref:Uncharacterized protein n=1 Tax=Tilletia horrida TaxID=155126 RepID=A0AAN6JJJ8_9BASI|nr:hypothetical protein OC842_004788 [Tilletia horrida]
MSFSDLPGEVVANIVDKVLHDCDTTNGSHSVSPPVSRPGPIDFIREAQLLRNVNRATNLAVDHSLKRKFHAFKPTFDPTARVHTTYWIPTLNSRRQDEVDYWQHHLGSPPPTIGNIRAQVANIDRANSIDPISVKVDARVTAYAMAYDFAGQSVAQFEKWIASGMLICRIARPNPRLRTLHIRMSLCNDFAFILEQILRQGQGLTDVVIEADMPTPWDYGNRSTLDLNNLTLPDTEYVRMDRLIIRAPGLDITAKTSSKFFERVKACTVFGFAVHSIKVPAGVAVWQWTQQLLKHMTSIERAEISVSADRFPGPLNNVAKQEIGVCFLPHLTHLTLDLQEVSADLLRYIEAPKLQHLRIRSQVNVGRRGPCKDGHFASLLTAVINCHGSYLDGFVALGKSLREVKDALDHTPRLNIKRYSSNEGWCRFGTGARERDYE